MDAAGRQPLLTPTEELLLGRSVQAWQRYPGGPAEAPPAIRRRGLRARDRIVAANLRLVAHIAGRFNLPAGMAMEDAFQAGAIGLMRGAELFDPERGYRLSTFCYWWIRQGITGEIDVTSNTIRIPANVHATMRGSRYGNVSDGQKDAAALVFGGLRSLDAMVPSTDGSTRTLADTIPASRLDVADLGQAEATASAWAAMEAADPDGLALLSLYHSDGARVGDLAELVGATRPATGKRLKAVTERLRALPAVQVALAS